MSPRKQKLNQVIQDYNSEQERIRKENLRIREDIKRDRKRLSVLRREVKQAMRDTGNKKFRFKGWNFKLSLWEGLTISAFDPIFIDMVNPSLSTEISLLEYLLGYSDKEPEEFLTLREKLEGLLYSK